MQDTVVQVIEQQLNGIDNLDYITSESNADGSGANHADLRAGHEPRHRAGAGAEQAAARRRRCFPQEVQQQGLRVTKPTRNFLIVLGFISTDGSMSERGPVGLRRDQRPRSAEPHARVSATCTMFGAQYAMRIWLDPAKLNNYGLTTGDVVAAIRAQNVQVSVGSIGGLPARGRPGDHREHHRPHALRPRRRSSATSCCA